MGSACDRVRTSNEGVTTSELAAVMPTVPLGCMLSLKGRSLCVPFEDLCHMFGTRAVFLGLVLCVSLLCV